MALTYVLWAAILGIGFFLGMAAAVASGFVEFLGSWQTLLAGVLAVCAALFTVNEMRRNEERQHARHEDLMRLTQRADRLRIDRAAACLVSLEPQAGFVTEAVTGLEIDDAESLTPPLASTGPARKLIDEVALLARLAKLEDLSACRDLFGGELAAAYDAMIISAGEVQRWRDIASRYFSIEGGASDKDVEICKRSILALNGLAPRLVRDVERFGRWLHELEEEYR
jgi:hypothetical protein